jgi:protease-4
MSVKKGWIVAFLVVFGLAAVGIVGMSMWLLSDGHETVKPASTLVLSFDDEVIEDPPAGARSRLFYRETPTMWDHLRALDHAANDPNVEAVLLDIDGIDMGWAKVEELREKLLQVEESGKKVIAYVEGGEDKDYYLATAADEIYMAPNSNLYLDGLASYETFFKGTLDKIGVKADLEHVGEYKSAVESFTQTAMSEAAREVANSLLDETYGSLVHGIQEGRDVDSTTALRLIDGGPYTSQQALAAGLVDSLIYDDELEDLLPGGEGGTQLELAEYLATITPAVAPAANKIALVYASGTIVEGKSGTDPLWGRTIGSDSFREALEAAREERGVRAIVVRVDSPGGEVYASHLMWRALRDASTDLPVVASFSDLAASGGYYLAMGADTILADEATLTGSIGVFGGKYNLKGLYEKLGFSFDVVTRGENALFMSSLRDFTPAERERYLKDMFDEYRTFVGIVAENRAASAEEIDKVARGRVWTGGQAYEHGLVDEIGGLEKAIAVAARMAELPEGAEPRVVTFPRLKRTFLQEFVNRLFEEEDFEAVRSAAAPPIVGDAAVRKGLELAGALGRLARKRTLALLPFAFDVR